MTAKKSTGTKSKAKAVRSPKVSPLRAVGSVKDAPESVDEENQETPLTVEVQPVLRKKELFERVVTISGAKKRDVKSIVEATLQVLGDALASGESLALPPFGRAKVNRQKDLASGEMLMVRLRRNAESGGEAGNQPAAPIAETSQ
ncbi:MAG: HU family DNA-binding protein [Albidovulum sp.]